MSRDLTGAYTKVIDEICQEHLPSKHEFFGCLKHIEGDRIKDPVLLGELYLNYQAAMHATRVMVYFLPYLNNPAARRRKLQIYIDDDGLPGGDTHHHQLARAFKLLGADVPMEDEQFGDLDTLKQDVNPDVAKFIAIVEETYPRSLGPWTIVETLSDNWLHSLCHALGNHFPHIDKDPYFAACFAQGVEERHGQEALSVSSAILEKRPELFDLFVRDAKLAADGLNCVWDGMLAILERNEP